LSEESVFPRTGLYQLLREHPAMLVSMIYVLASAIGMLFSWAYLWHFGINFFDYAQIGDFLLASLKEPYTWVVVILVVVGLWFDNRSSLRWSRKERPRWLRWYGSERYRRSNYLTGMLLVLFLLPMYAYQQARATYAGRMATVEIRLAERDVRYQRVILGTTAQYLFTFDPVAREVSIHPAEAVEVIRFATPRRGYLDGD
jgi:hypothetical protein